MSVTSSHELFERLARASDRRRRAGLPVADQTDCYCMVFDKYDDLPGLIINRLGRYAVARLRTAEWRDPAVALRVAQTLAALGVHGTWIQFDEKNKHTTRQMAEQEAALNATLAAEGLGAPTTPFVVRENGNSFEMSFTDGFSQGLFLDMREPRAALARRWTRGRTLNLFAYTCGFGVSLARSSRVTNVDVSQPALDRGRRNYELNGLPVDDSTFVCDDAFAFLEAAVADGRKWEHVVLDPPAFSRGGRTGSAAFSIRKDFGRLVEMALDVLPVKGELFVSTNYEALESDAFRRLIIGISRDRGTRLEQQWKPAADYPVTAGRYHLKTALLVRERVDGVWSPEERLRGGRWVSKATNRPMRTYPVPGAAPAAPATPEAAPPARGPARSPSRKRTPR